MLQVKKVLEAAVTDHTLVGSEADISDIASRIMELARPFDSDRSGGYSVGEFCSHAGDDGTVRLYQCTVNHPQGEAWSDEYFAVRDTSALFSTADASTDPEPSGLLKNPMLDKAIIKVVTSLFDDGEATSYPQEG